MTNSNNATHRKKTYHKKIKTHRQYKKKRNTNKKTRRAYTNRHYSNNKKYTQSHKNFISGGVGSKVATAVLGTLALANPAQGVRTKQFADRQDMAFRQDVDYGVPGLRGVLNNLFDSPQDRHQERGRGVRSDFMNQHISQDVDAQTTTLGDLGLQYFGHGQDLRNRPVVSLFDRGAQEEENRALKERDMRERHQRLLTTHQQEEDAQRELQRAMASAHTNVNKKSISRKEAEKLYKQFLSDVQKPGEEDVTTIQQEEDVATIQQLETQLDNAKEDEKQAIYELGQHLAEANRIQTEHIRVAHLVRMTQLTEGLMNNALTISNTIEHSGLISTNTGFAVLQYANQVYQMHTGTSLLTLAAGGVGTLLGLSSSTVIIAAATVSGLGRIIANTFTEDTIANVQNSRDKLFFHLIATTYASKNVDSTHRKLIEAQEELAKDFDSEDKQKIVTSTRQLYNNAVAQLRIVGDKLKEIGLETPISDIDYVRLNFNSMYQQIVLEPQAFLKEILFSNIKDINLKDKEQDFIRNESGLLPGFHTGRLLKDESVIYIGTDYIGDVIAPENAPYAFKEPIEVSSKFFKDLNARYAEFDTKGKDSVRDAENTKAYKYGLSLMNEADEVQIIIEMLKAASGKKPDMSNIKMTDLGQAMEKLGDTVIGKIIQNALYVQDMKSRTTMSEKLETLDTYKQMAGFIIDNLYNTPELQEALNRLDTELREKLSEYITKYEETVTYSQESSYSLRSITKFFSFNGQTFYNNFMHYLSQTLTFIYNMFVRALDFSQLQQISPNLAIEIVKYTRSFIEQKRKSHQKQEQKLCQERISERTITKGNLIAWFAKHATPRQDHPFVQRQAVPPGVQGGGGNEGTKNPIIDHLFGLNKILSDTVFKYVDDQHEACHSNQIVHKAIIYALFPIIMILINRILKIEEYGLYEGTKTIEYLDVIDELLNTAYNRLILLLSTAIKELPVETNEDINTFEYYVQKIIFGDFIVPMQSMIKSIDDLLTAASSPYAVADAQTFPRSDTDMTSATKDKKPDLLLQLLDENDNGEINIKILIKQLYDNYTTNLSHYITILIKEGIDKTKIKMIKSELIFSKHKTNEEAPLDDGEVQPPPLETNDDDNDVPPLEPTPPPPRGGTKYIYPKTPKKHKSNKRYFDNSKKKNKKHQNLFNTSLKK
jgi:hypothetical protein